MKVQRTRTGTRYMPQAPHESLALIASMNERHFCYEAAAKCYREAADVAPEHLRALYIADAERCEKEANR